MGLITPIKKSNPGMQLSTVDGSTYVEIKDAYGRPIHQFKSDGTYLNRGGGVGKIGRT